MSSENWLANPKDWPYVTEEMVDNMFAAVFEKTGRDIFGERPFGVVLPAQFDFASKYGMANALGLHVPETERDENEEKYVLCNGVWMPRDAMFTKWEGAVLNNLYNKPWPGIPSSSWRNYFGFDEEEKPKPPPVVKEERTEAIVAWRAWDYRHISKRYGFLESCTQDYQWPPGEAAEGDINDGDGIYGFAEHPRFAKSSFEGHEIHGTVSLWGKVFEHADGVYRAQFAYPRHLWVQKNFDDDVSREEAQAILARLYGCEVELA